eukprot:g1690.t1
MQFRGIMSSGRIPEHNQLNGASATVTSTSNSHTFGTRVARNGCLMTIRPRVSAGVRPRTAATRVYSHSDSISPKAATTKIPEILSDTQDDNAEKKFNWFKNWWAVQVVDDLETDRPNKIQLLNKDYIVWKGHNGDWIAMDDECPHRLAPLSEGRIEKDGNLLCSYHAWRFNESGKCVKIPHAEDEKAHTVACNSARSSVQAYPCKTRADYFERDISERPITAYHRIFPYSFDTLMENVADPSHFIVSHHGAIPVLNRYKAGPMNMQHTDAMKGHKILDAVLYENPPFASHAHAEIRPPGVIIAYNEATDGRPASRLFLCMRPISPGRSAAILIDVLEKMIEQTGVPNFFTKLFYAYTRLVHHSKIANRVLDGDTVLLHGQEKSIRNRGSKFSTAKDYFIPTNADTLVLSFRKWFEANKTEAVDKGSESFTTQTALSKEQLLDRYEQHTKHCKTCSQALSNIRSAIRLLKTVFVLSSLVVCAIVFKSFSAGSLSSVSFLKNIKLMISAFISMIALKLASLLEEKVIPLFYFVDLSHPDID